MVNGNGSLRADRPLSQRREILRLAVPAFLALVAEPLFLLADSAIIGHLGTTQLAGLGVASAALITAANIFVFLAYGTPAMLVVLAVTGVLRGLQDTRTPLVASVVGFSSNIALNLLLVYGLHIGIAGSALGTVLAQCGMAAALVFVVTRRARQFVASLRPHPARVLRAGLDGIPLLVRTLALRTVLLVTAWVAAGLGDVPLAAYQVAATIWTFLAFSLDALALSLIHI